MSSVSTVTILSNALLMCGAQTINSLEGDLSDRQRIAVNLYPTVRDYVLSSHPWNCCRKRVLLNADTAAPAFGWTLQYTLPADFARMYAIGDDDDPPFDYAIEDGKLLTDEAAPLKLRYLYLNQNEARWSALLVYAVTASMRQVLAYPITQSTSLEQLLDQTLEPILQRARAVDSQDSPAETLGDFPLLQSRFSNYGTGLR